ncbi:protein patched homolog 1-like isoform X2 [Babylonia areolata]|uniref:protein patched homolog 1-like isoform X2 n=1 Tax=Babylonia areolata TaxID=304850 RepID=UPI003FD59C03
MESWSNPANRPLEGLTMTSGTKRDSTPKSDPELLTRTSWVNAATAYRQVKRGRADGNKCALLLRLHLQRHLYSLGCFLQLHCGKVLFLGLLLLSLCCVGLKTAHIETNVEELWVEEGGRLEQELKYTRDTLGEGSGTSYEVLIQTPKKRKNLLNIDSILLHFQAVYEATQVQVEIDGVTWKFRDICYAANFPLVEDELFDHILYGLLPCVIITPMDCFWEGSLLLGPDYPANTGGINGIPEQLTWANLNPVSIVTAMVNNDRTEDLGRQLEEIMNTSGVGTAYQEKPCLNPHDQQCPDTAPNKHSKQVPDLGGILTGGCSGFSSKYMQWPEDLLFGGLMKNKTGHISRVEAYQSILQLMGEQNLYDYWSDTLKTSGTNWNVEAARSVLEKWQRKFVSVVNEVNNATTRDNIYSFSYTSLMDIMEDFSSISVTRVVIGYVLMFIYACISLMRWSDAVNSQSGVGMAGVMLVSLSVAAGLGICSVLGVRFNASTTQIIPFLALGLGVDDMFLIAHTYSEIGRYILSAELTGEVLKRTGVTVLLTSVTNMLAFFTAAIIPIPALRAFSMQAALLVLFNMASVLVVFPAIVSLDLARRDDNRIDVLCCFQSAGPSNPVLGMSSRSRDYMRGSQRDQSPPPSYTPPPAYSSPTPSSSSSSSSFPKHHAVTRTSSDGSSPVTSLAPTDSIYVRRTRETIAGAGGCPSTTSSQQCLTHEEGVTCGEHCAQARRHCHALSLTCLALRLYTFLLERTFVKVMVMMSFGVMLVVGAWGVAQVKDGLDLTDIVPKGTPEYSFLEAQAQYFGFYGIYAVTKGDFDYPNNQKLLYDYHAAFQRVQRISKREDGTVPTFWLDIFRQWLQQLQASFDRDVAVGTVTESGWNHNASDEGILAYKLLSQTGDVDNPFDKTKVMSKRLVSGEGIINPAAFYNYLSAWYANDAMAYSASMASLHPVPKEWRHIPYDYDFHVLKSQPVVYAQIPFFLTNLTTTEEIIDAVVAIREVCDEFSKRGLPNYPSGYPFTYWEQYINLRFYLLMALLCVLSTTFIVLTITLMNPWLAALVVAVLAMVVVELFGFMGVTGIKLSAVPAVILIMTVGIGVEFTLHVAVGFVTAIGNRNRRVLIATEHTFAPVIHGATSTFLGIIMLLSTQFDFIIKYFFTVLAALVLLGVLNGLLLFPVLLSYLGPKGEVIPKGNADRLSTPTPEPSPRLPLRHVRSSSSSVSSSSSRGRRVYPRRNSDISLSTITEEPTQYSSHEIIVQPEVVVETTTVPNSGVAATGGGGEGGGGDGSRSSRAKDYVEDDTISSSSCDSGINAIPVTLLQLPSTSSSGQPTTVTKVKATATVKVEVHTPCPGAVSQEHTYKSKRRKMRQLKEKESQGRRRLSEEDSEC